MLGFYKPITGFNVVDTKKANDVGFKCVHYRVQIPFLLETIVAVEGANDCLNYCTNLSITPIVRFAYSYTSTPIDPPTNRIVAHIQAIANLLKGFSFILDAGFIGSWGEWNNSASDNLTLASRGRILAALYANFPQQIINLRTPMLIAEHFPRHVRNVELLRTGVHNDAFMSSTSSATDKGTYESPNQTYWKEFCSDLALFGGETCADTPQLQNPSLVFAEIQKTRCQYLNADYFPNVVSRWKSQNVYDLFNQAMKENAK